MELWVPTAELDDTNPFDFALLAQQEIESVARPEQQRIIARTALDRLRQQAVGLADRPIAAITTLAVLPVQDDESIMQVVKGGEVEIKGILDSFALLDLSRWGMPVNLGLDIMPLQALACDDLERAAIVRGYPLIAGMRTIVITDS